MSRPHLIAMTISACSDPSQTQILMKSVVQGTTKIRFTNILAEISLYSMAKCMLHGAEPTGPTCVRPPPFPGAWPGGNHGCHVMDAIDVMLKLRYNYVVQSHRQIQMPVRRLLQDVWRNRFQKLWKNHTLAKTSTCTLYLGNNLHTRRQQRAGGGEEQ